MYYGPEDQTEDSRYLESGRPASRSEARQDVGHDEQSHDNSIPSRPDAQRSLTDPSPAMMLQGYFAAAAAAPVKYQATASRNRSPYSRSHLRSRSSGSALAGAPVMIRAHSMPAVHLSSRACEFSDPATPSSGSLSPKLTASHSPQRSPGRVRSPLSAEHEAHSYFPQPRSPHWFETSNGGPIESIQEDSELDLTPRNSAAFMPTPPPPPPVTLTSRTAGMRRRPASPLHSVAAVSPSLVDAGQESPALAPAKCTEAVPSSFQLHHYASTSSFSSISSTPSSTRSRSPSISSLETIEDAPDAEYEAIEADRLWRLQLSEKGERSEDAGDETYRRKGFGFGRGRNSERKRWSVCGGERRADLDLETIWED